MRLFCRHFVAVVLMIIGVAILSCSLVFLMAEQTRVKEGITFKDAYWTPLSKITVQQDLDSFLWPQYADELTQDKDQEHTPLLSPPSS